MLVKLVNMFGHYVYEYDTGKFIESSLSSLAFEFSPGQTSRMRLTVDITWLQVVNLLDSGKIMIFIWKNTHTIVSCGEMHEAEVYKKYF